MILSRDLMTYKEVPEAIKVSEVSSVKISFYLGMVIIDVIGL